MNALSHERLTPLNSLINMSEILMKMCEKSSALENLSDESRDFYTFVIKYSKTIWSVSKLMHMMTSSQINHYQIDCKRVQFTLSMLTV